MSVTVIAISIDEKQFDLICLFHFMNRIICPEGANASYEPSLWSIMSKVRLEAFLWGAGTALGELPPYFMARASRLSGYDPDDADDLKEFEELNKKRDLGVELSLMERAKIFMEKAVEKVGFFGILACASVSHHHHHTQFNTHLHIHQITKCLFFSFVICRYQIHCSTWLALPAAISSCPSGHSSVPHCSARL